MNQLHHASQVLVSALYFLAVLSVLVMAHEWGHFAAARAFRMRVLDFSLFFGRVLWRVGVRNGTSYNVRTIPLGGFVRIAGMEPEEMQDVLRICPGRTVDGQPVEVRGIDAEAVSGVDAGRIGDSTLRAIWSATGTGGSLTADGPAALERLLRSGELNEDEAGLVDAVLATVHYRPDPASYSQKPVWQRAAVIAAGPAMSLVLGYVIFCALGMTVGLPDSRILTVGVVRPGMPAAAAGLRVGDRVVGLNGVSDPAGDKVIDTIHGSIGKPVLLTLERGSDRFSVMVTPKAQDSGIREHGLPKMVGMIGISPSAAVWQRYSPLEAVAHGSTLMANYVAGTFGAIFSREVRQNVGGIITIGRQINQDAQDGFRYVVLTAAMLSISLGIVNLLPIPVLDGGHLMLLAVEAIRRRRLTLRQVYAAQMIGISIIGAAFVLVLYNDILRLIRPSQ